MQKAVEHAVLMYIVLVDVHGERVDVNTHTDFINAGHGRYLK